MALAAQLVRTEAGLVAGWLPFSPALLILWAPALFRLTCYYYRGAYYKAFWADPPACAVGEPRRTISASIRFRSSCRTSIAISLSRARVHAAFLAHDVWKAMWFADAATGTTRFGIGVGTLVLAINVVLLGGYTFGCHSLRHLVGGFLDRASERPLAKTYDCVSCLNRRHMLWAWMSLFRVGFADLYVRLCSMGVWTDWRSVK